MPIHKVQQPNQTQERNPRKEPSPTPDLTPKQHEIRVRVCIFRTFTALVGLEDGLGFLDRGDPVYADAMIRHEAFKACQMDYPDDIINEATEKLTECLRYGKGEPGALPPFPERLHWNHSGWTNGKGHVDLSGEQVNAYMDAAEAFRDVVVQR